MKLTKPQIIAMVARAFLSMGQGLKVPEIAAITGLTEDQVWKGFKGRIDFQDRGDLGWFYTSTRPIQNLIEA